MKWIRNLEIKDDSWKKTTITALKAVRIYQSLYCTVSMWVILKQSIKNIFLIILHVSFTNTKVVAFCLH